MPWEELLDNLARLPPGSHGPWLRGAAGVAAVVALLLWLERWYFARSGRAGSWAVVRLVSLVAAPVALGLLFGPARAVSGMEALAVFYISLLTVTPAVWFGAHWLAGAPRHFVWKETFTMTAGSRARWACGQVACRPVHMSTGRVLNEEVV